MRNVMIVAGAFAALVLAACEPSKVTRPPEDGTLTVQVSLTSATITSLTLEVTGPGIAQPLMANLTVSGTTATGTLEIPAGADRRFVVKGYDAAGNLVYQGEKTSSVQAGQTLSVAVTLAALTSSATVTVTVGAVTVTLTPGASTLAAGGTSTYTATASENGTAIANPQIVWASSIPSIASVSAAGVVTAHAPGSVRIAASFRGVAAGADLTVQE
ncbi:Ig-like domain-containing protein [Longimicrobium sp.]|uniref:Ig-like domain-containing protein n=1 Tax=Longimicrobium sp. TaxID=2029185 RepID=UPI003B3AB853